MATPLMPHATAFWLVENTALSFDQIAEFCGLHPLEVQAIADENTPVKLIGRDPVRAGELNMQEIEKGQADPSYRLTMLKGPTQSRRTKGPRYTPVSKRQNKPDGIAWILRNHPEVSDTQIGKLVGATKTTVLSIRDKTHWNMQNITPKDPVTLGLCAQRELDAAVALAAKRAGAVASDPVPDARYDAERDAMVEQLRREREETARIVDSGDAEKKVDQPLTPDTLFKY